MNRMKKHLAKEFLSFVSHSRPFSFDPNLTSHLAKLRKVDSPYLTLQHQCD